MNINDLVVDKATRTLLTANGRQDGLDGADRYKGWETLAISLDMDPHRRTPAQEAYLDGWFAGKAEAAKRAKK